MPSVPPVSRSSGAGSLAPLMLGKPIVYHVLRFDQLQPLLRSHCTLSRHGNLSLETRPQSQPLLKKNKTQTHC